MAEIKVVDPARLYPSLLNTGLQTKDNPLYQVLYQLIGQVLKITNVIVGGGGGGGGNIINNFNTILQQFEFDTGSGGGDGDLVAIPGPPGASGTSADSTVPYFIATGDTFIVPLYKQALFATNIDNEGTLEIDGLLIEVN